MVVTNQVRARQYLAHRNLPYTFSFFLRQSATRYVVMLAAFGAILLGCWLEPADWAIKTGIFFTGWTCAVVWRDSAWFRAIKSAWPFNELVTDWNKVQELAELDAVNPQATNPDAPSKSN